MDVRISESPLLRNRTSLLGVLPLFFALLFLIVGSLLLNDQVSNSDVGQTARFMTGATFLSLALISICVALKNWWKHRKSDAKALRNHSE